MMGWLRNWRIERAARRYAADLPPALLQWLGPRKYYTVCQVRTAVKALGLNPRYIVLGHACFLPEERFRDELESMKVRMPYAQARAIMARHLPQYTGPGGWLAAPDT
ncbi:MAG TPA: DUF6559 family protein [Rhizomicrobium sp.]|jgi:hypothetical protein|nr:DUF6559 family protein [Rhizomicrobium sp.]